MFDKTGTLTTGQFSIAAYHSEIEETEFRKILYSLEKHSAHPLARTIAAAYKNNGEIQWKEIEEIKGLGIKGLDKEGNTWWAGSHKLLKEQGNEPTHSIYLLKNNEVIGWLDSTDEIRPEAQQVITWFRSKNIHTILLSGDKKENCSLIAGILGIDEVFSEQSPQQKLDKIAELTRQQPTAMVGDGINDAPALSKATLGISLSGASQIAMQSADVILLQHGLKNLPQALGLGKHTYLTIKQNLFWAFLYNTIAIPVAAMGMLTPTVSALSMAMSDIVLAFNSIRLFIKKVY